MKFDVVIGNPPYQVMNAGENSAKPLYHHFVNRAQNLKVDIIVMIIPARWYAVSQELRKFRQSMADGHLRKLVDFESGKECFADVCVAGGVCYFLWDRNYHGPCEIVNIPDRGCVPTLRPLNEFPVIVRYNGAVSILRKVLGTRTPSLASLIVRAPYKLPTSFRGESEALQISVYSSGGRSYISIENLPDGHSHLKTYRVMFGAVSAEFSCEPDTNRQFKIISPTMRVLGPNEVCTDSYRLAGNFHDKQTAENLLHYLQTKFTRFLMRLCMTGINITEATFRFVPIQDFSKTWTDKELYQAYQLTDREIEFIETMIK